MQRIFQQDQFSNPTQCMNAQVLVLAQGRAWQPGLLKHSHRLAARALGCWHSFPSPPCIMEMLITRLQATHKSEPDSEGHTGSYKNEQGQGL